MKSSLIACLTLLAALLAAATRSGVPQDGAAAGRAEDDMAVW